MDEALGLDDNVGGASDRGGLLRRLRPKSFKGQGRVFGVLSERFVASRFSTAEPRLLLKTKTSLLSIVALLDVTLASPWIRRCANSFGLKRGRRGRLIDETFVKGTVVEVMPPAVISSKAALFAGIASA